MAEPIQLHATGPEPHTEVVELLTRLLRRAESGELRGLVFVAQLTGEETAFAAVGEMDCPTTVAYAELLKQRALSEWAG